MQALIAPLLAGGAGAAAAGTAAAAATPFATAATLFKIAAPIASGVSGMQQAKAQQKEAETNAYIGKTRAIQTDTSARQGLESELGTLRATLGANGQRPGVGTMEVMQELRTTRNRERRIAFGNEMQNSRAFAASGQAYGAQGKAALGAGFIKAGPSLLDLYELRRA